jgi:putative CocE/NonD family hydrolase
VNEPSRVLSAKKERKWRKRLLKMLALLFVLTLVALAGLYLARDHVMRIAFGAPAFTHGLGEPRPFEVKMRDGAKLVGTVTPPEGEGPWPTVLYRDPYGFLQQFCPLFARYGYACVHQSVRGRGESEGEWVPIRHEREDGLDTLAWLVKQDFVDGNIAMLGPSYLGMAQWAVADALPPEVKTLVITTAHGDVYSPFYEGGHFKHLVASDGAALDAANPLSAREAARNARPGPSSERDLGMKLPHYDAWVRSPWRQDEWWTSDHYKPLDTAPENTKVPVLIISGWYDMFIDDQIEWFNRLASREDSRLIVFPTAHMGQTGSLAFDDVGIGANLRATLDWLDVRLRGGSPVDRMSGVKSWVIGDGTYSEHAAWPPSTTERTYYLADAGRAESCDGGALVDLPASTSSVRFRYDPADPMPSQGGYQVLLDERAGSHDQAALCARSDVVSFVSAPLQSDLHLAGRIQIKLKVASEAEDTAFFVRVLDIDDAGPNRNIRQAITSLRARAGVQIPTAYTPRQPVTLSFDLAPIERVVKAGHRLRLEVSSSSFPIFHPHPNTAEPWSTAKPVVTMQTVFDEGSSLVLPVLDLKRGP